MEQVSNTESPKQAKTTINRSDHLVTETLDAEFSPAIIQEQDTPLNNETIAFKTMDVPAGESLVAVASQPGRNKTGLDTEESEKINLEMAAVEKNIDVLRTEMLQMQKEEEEIEEK